MSSPTVVSFTDAPSSEHRSTPDAGRLLEGNPEHITRPYFESADGGFVTGVWESTPGKWRALTGKDEFCFIIKGHLRLVSDTGGSHTFKTGDSFVVSREFSGYWEVIENTTKHYAIRKYPDDREV